MAQIPNRFKSKTATKSAPAQEKKEYTKPVQIDSDPIVMGGGIWARTSKAGNEYYSIAVELNMAEFALAMQNVLGDPESISISFRAFPNQDKVEGDKRPDFRVMRAKTGE